MVAGNPQQELDDVFELPISEGVIFQIKHLTKIQVQLSAMLKNLILIKECQI